MWFSCNRRSQKRTSPKTLYGDHTGNEVICSAESHYRPLNMTSSWFWLRLAPLQCAVHVLWVNYVFWMCHYGSAQTEICYYRHAGCTLWSNSGKKSIDFILLFKLRMASLSFFYGNHFKFSFEDSYLPVISQSQHTKHRKRWFYRVFTFWKSVPLAPASVLQLPHC